MDEPIESDVLDRLDRAGLEDRVADLVLAALLDDIEACLGGKTPLRPSIKPKQIEQPVRAYVESISVEGFRGIGPKATVSLRPGPGLTLIVGRNGSGKSSFSEALELLLTGENQRWGSKRTRIWKEGWRNLHHPDLARIEAKLSIDGRAGSQTVARSWKASDDLEDGGATVSYKGKSAPLTSLGWSEALSTYRPFLSYNELGSMLEEGPSRLFDALAAILGLEDLIAAADSLKETRVSRTKAHKAVRDRLDEICEILKTHPDERAAKCLEAFADRHWQLDGVTALLSADSTSAEADSEIRRLRELASLRGPEPAAVDDVLQALNSALAARAAVAHTDAAKARRRAEILEKALDFHRHEGDSDCPICGRPSALTDTWRRQAEEEIRNLRRESENADAADRHVLVAERAARHFIAAPPASIKDPDLLKLWNAWKEGETKAGNELVAHVEYFAPKLDHAIQKLRSDAQIELKKREDLWRPVAEVLAQWIPDARKMLSELEAVSWLKSAEDWLRTTATTIHNERFLPIKERVKRIWELLRTQSHVELEDVSFQGKSTSRRVNLDVTVDGTRGAALGVMSQGELHSLALALFLPRATLEHSPFRFVFIDDPVQSMDPARVDGLARVLQMVAKKRQVVIFTHDDRLPEALRRLQVEANIIEVLRREGSVVELREVRNPVRQYLDDGKSK